MIQAVVSEHTNVSPDRVRALYGEPGNWPRLLPATIREARIVRREESSRAL